MHVPSSRGSPGRYVRMVGGYTPRLPSTDLSPPFYCTVAALLYGMGMGLENVAGVHSWKWWMFQRVVK